MEAAHRVMATAMSVTGLQAFCHVNNNTVYKFLPTLTPLLLNQRLLVDIYLL